VPVTAKLSRKFYEKFGDDIANELVEWFNMVDSTYRSELRELNEWNYTRFDAKLEQRIAELDAKLDRRITELEAKLERLIAELRAEMQVGSATLAARLEQRMAELETRLTKRMFGFWIAQAATTVGLVFGVVKLLQ
jgi:DNA anti-recombination protein RmuC